MPKKRLEFANAILIKMRTIMMELVLQLLSWNKRQMRPTNEPYKARDGQIAERQGDSK